MVDRILKWPSNISYPNLWGCEFEIYSDYVLYEAEGTLQI